MEYDAQFIAMIAVLVGERSAEDSVKRAVEIYEVAARVCSERESKDKDG